MTELWDVPVAQIRRGDVIRTDQDDITVEEVDRLADEGALPDGWRIHGRITRGTGRGRTIRTWRYYPDHVFPTIIRGTS